MLAPLSERALRRWPDILAKLGVLDSKALRGKHTACPVCGGKDRFRFDNKQGRGSWICSQCGAGNGVDLVKAVLGLEFKQAAERIESVIGIAARVEPKAELSEAECRAACNRLWRASKPACEGDAVDRYLSARGLGGRGYPTSLRCGDGMMVAMVTAPDGRPMTLHRTYLTADGRKASVEVPRKLMPGQIAKGSAVRLAPACGHLGIAEGIETALSAAILFNLPVWAALNANLLREWQPPAGVVAVTVFADNDANFTGQEAAYSLARRLSGNVAVDVQTPRGSGTDWNDVLLQGMGSATERGCDAARAR
jgi:putative DNA primase/helicase